MLPASGRGSRAAGPSWLQQASAQVGGPMQPNSWRDPSAQSQMAIAKQLRGGQLV
jgi:hypothetical protein